jgi:hypothetical protein
VDENNIGEVVLRRAINAPIALGPKEGIIGMVSDL